MKTRLRLFTEEGRTRSKNFARRIKWWVVGAFVIACGSTYPIGKYYVIPHLIPIHRFYLGQYWTSSYKSYLRNTTSHYEILARTIADPHTKKDVTLFLTKDQLEPLLFDDGTTLWVTADGQPEFTIKDDVENKTCFWWESNYPDAKAYEFFRNSIYEEKTIPQLFILAWIGAIGIFAVEVGLIIAGDQLAQRFYLKGELIRGTQKLSPQAYERAHRHDTGYGLTVYAAELKSLIVCLRLIAGCAAASFKLRVPRKEETEGLLLLGDPGTGKSQVIHQMFLEIRWRKPAEAGICYDPEGEFVQKYYDPDRDILFNPFDDRCPYWSPLLEGNRQNAAARAADWKMIAESFLPDRRHGAPNSDFFIDAARRILTRILEVARDLPSIIEILIREDLIDQVVAGTELAHLITPGAKGQRGGVLATLSEVGETLRLLPPREQCSKALSLTEWAKRRKGWIFITAKHDNRDALRRFHAASINILMKRLLAADPEWARSNPCWVIIDEVHALGHLSALPTAIVEGRKHGLKIIVGTQNKTQIEEIYGRLAATMLACFHTKVIFRCNEPECARWLSDLIGEDETERPRLSTTASVPHHGRDSINYNTVTERRAVVSKEEIMAVGNLYGYWKYGSVVVMFRIEPLLLRSIAKSFVERQSPPAVSQTLPVTLPHENGKERPEIATEEPDDLDITF